MKKLFAVPCINGRLSAHFGHCEKFAIVTVEDNNVSAMEFVDPPFHEPGSHPRFLHELGVNTIIAGGMGSRALDLFKTNEIEVAVGAVDDTPENLVNQFLNDNLQTNDDNLCDH